MKYIKGFEIIDITGSGNNILNNITLENIQANADSGTLHIMRDNGDKVNFNDSWTNIGQISEGQISYDIYRHNSMTDDANDVWVQIIG